MILKHLQDLKDGGWLVDLPEVLELLNTNYGYMLKRSYEELNTDVLYESFAHGRAHIERVMLFGALIAMNQRLSKSDTRLLLIACSYHDIGRINDLADPEHGRRGAEEFERLAPFIGISDSDMRIVQSAIAGHSLNDNMIEKCMSDFEVEDSERCTLIFKGLKDADALDRVRFNGLNVDYLRLDESKPIASYARKILVKDFMGEYLFKH